MKTEVMQIRNSSPYIGGLFFVFIHVDKKGYRRAFMTRREAREQTFILLFEKSVQNKTTEEVFEDAADARDFELKPFIKKLVEGVDENQEFIDKIISENIKSWNIKRISKVTLCILRLAICEILFEKDIPVSVSINEAVELAKIYGGQGDANYINGVLSSVEKKAEYEKDEN